MARDSREVVRGILVVVNECLGILGLPRLDGSQCGVLIGVLCGMARKPAPLQKPFNKRLLDVIKMKNKAEQKYALARLLGMNVQ